MTNLRSDERCAPLVTEDQSRINTFSKLNTRMSDLDDELKRVLVRPPLLSNPSLSSNLI